jgi:hypothetical protein
VPPERRPDSLSECLGAVEDEEARDRRVETAFDKVVEQRLRGDRVCQSGNRK